MLVASSNGPPNIDSGERKSSAESCVHRIRKELAMSGYAAIRRLACECQGKVVAISGELPNFYQKQVAITLAMRCLPQGAPFCHDITIVHFR